MPIIGESLNIVGLDLSKDCIIKIYDIIKNDERTFINERVSEAEKIKNNLPNYFTPIITMFDKLSEMKNKAHKN